VKFFEKGKVVIWSNQFMSIWEFSNNYKMALFIRPSHSSQPSNQPCHWPTKPFLYWTPARAIPYLSQPLPTSAAPVSCRCWAPPSDEPPDRAPHHSFPPFPLLRSDASRWCPHLSPLCVRLPHPLLRRASGGLDSTALCDRHQVPVTPFPWWNCCRRCLSSFPVSATTACSPLDWLAPPHSPLLPWSVGAITGHRPHPSASPSKNAATAPNLSTVAVAAPLRCVHAAPSLPDASASFRGSSLLPQNQTSPSMLLVGAAPSPPPLAWWPRHGRAPTAPAGMGRPCRFLL
jgi:hypothetical protein